MATVAEGFMPFLGYQTWYRIVGTKTDNGKAPLIFLHGGPGSTHNYFEVLDWIADADGRQLVMYDQLGCGNSYLDGHPELWNQETWLDELEALRAHLGLKECHILGQSWGGMMQIAYAIERKPEGVKSFVISSGHPSSSLWRQEGLRRVGYLPAPMQAAIAEALRTGIFSGPDYDAAVAEYMRRHCDYTVTPDSPDCLTRPKRRGAEAYLYGWGPNEFSPTGTLRDFEYVDRLGEIGIPSLIMSGVADLCSPLIAKTMFDGIPGARWELFAHSRHMCFVEETEKYASILLPWLNAHD
jgi:proline iminopeptidase